MADEERKEFLDFIDTEEKELMDDQFLERQKLPNSM